MKKRTLTAWLLTAAMLASLLPTAAFAASGETEGEETPAAEESTAAEQTVEPTTVEPDEESAEEELSIETVSSEGYQLAASSGTCGDDLTWTMEDGVLTISGTGDMTYYSSSSSAPWYDSRESITSVVIGDGVTSIGSYAFYYCTGLTSVTIPYSVIRIYTRAFSNCSGLTGIVIPDSTRYIASYAFFYCTSLTEIQVSENNTTYCSEDGVLFNIDMTELICYPAGKTTVSYTIPNSVVTIDYGAFEGCTALTSVTIPDSVTSINTYAFEGCYSLTSVTIPSSVTSIDSCAFCYCSGLTSVIISSGVTSIGSYAFYCCTGLTDVAIPDSVTSIGVYAFYYCTGLTSLTIGSGVTSIEWISFDNCAGLTEIQVSTGNAVYCSMDGVLFNKDMTELICYPAGKTEAIYTIPTSVTIIDSYAFYNSTDLTSVIIGSGVTTIDNYAFYNCSSLINISIPYGVESIESYTFAYCTALTAVAIPTSVTTIDSSAFSGCSALTDVYYGGTAEGWSGITIGSDNTYLDSSKIHYSSASFLLGHVILSKLNISSSGITLTWNTAAYAEGYYIYRKADSEETYQLLATVSGASTLSYTDTQVEDGVTYSYYVQAYNGDETGTYSGEKCITYLSSTVTEANELTSEATRNTGGQSYTVYYASTVNSYLTETETGFMRVEDTGSQVVVEYYDSEYTLTEKKYVQCELSLFGGFYAGEDAYYLVFGQTNPKEDDNVEVIRVVKYSTDWERLGQASLYGANTYIPFDAGSCRMTEYGGYLYVRTCHEMYASSDGLHHQANMTVEVQESTMEIVDAHYTVSAYSTGYVSHSFNQFVLVDDEENLILLDHGDGYPRAVALTLCGQKAGSSNLGTSGSRVAVLYLFEGDYGQNYTGASLGGLEYSSTSYLAVGNSVTQDDDWDSHTARNVFVTVTDRDNLTSSGTTVKWITDYDDDGIISASTPQLVKLDSDSFLLLWTTTEYLDSSISYSRHTKLHYVYLDGEGNTTSDIYTVDGQISDCQPIVSDGSVVWYVTGDANGTSTATTPCFYSIDADGTFTVQANLATPSFAVEGTENGLEVSWEPVDGAEGYYVYYSYSAQTVEGGDTTSATITRISSGTYAIWVEAYAGSDKSLALDKVLFSYLGVPSLTNTGSGVQVSWSAAAEGETYAVYRKTANTDYVLLGTTADTSWMDTNVVSGTTYTYLIYALSEDAIIGSSAVKSLTLPAADSTDETGDDGSHTHSYTSKVTKSATCTTAGVRTYTCSGCGDIYTESIPATGHSAGSAVTENYVDATCTKDGSYDTVVYCETCGAEISRTAVTVKAAGHTAGSAVKENVVEATATTDGSYDSVVYCETCGAEISRETVTVPATGSGTHTHSWTSSVTTTATCTTAGVRTYTCSGCGESYTESILATGHNAGNAVTENYVAATLLKSGSYDSVVYCTRCGEELSRTTVTIPATGSDTGDTGDTGDDSSHTHSYTSAVTKTATCGTDGVMTYTCSGCGDSYTEIIPATGNHTWDSGTVTLKATRYTEGEKTYTCTVCGATKTETIAKLTTAFLFNDVQNADEYYYTPVYWAYDLGITTGTSTTLFSPTQGCTRAQFVTFLWRLAGEPTPTTASCSFTDLDTGEYYYHAVLWAVEQGVTNGTSATAFSPNDKISRAQAVTMLYRYAGSPSVSGLSNSFNDVPSGEYYYNAVLWAVKRGITNGTSATKFSPDDTCDRAMMVTYLYRYAVAPLTTA